MTQFVTLEEMTQLVNVARASAEAVKADPVVLSALQDAHLAVRAAVDRQAIAAKAIAYLLSIEDEIDQPTVEFLIDEFGYDPITETFRDPN